MSHTQMRADMVLARCAAFANRRRARIERRKEEFIANMMNKKPGFLARLLGCKPKTREEAERHWETADSGILNLTPRHLEEISGGLQWREVSRLWSLAEAAVAENPNAMMSVSAEDWNNIR